MNLKTISTMNSTVKDTENYEAIHEQTYAQICSAFPFLKETNRELTLQERFGSSYHVKSLPNHPDSSLFAQPILEHSKSNICVICGDFTTNPLTTWRYTLKKRDSVCQECFDLECCKHCHIWCGEPECSTCKHEMYDMEK